MGFVRVGFAALIAVLASLVVVAPASADHDTYGVAEYGYGAGLVSDLETPLAIPGSQEHGAADRHAPAPRRTSHRPASGSSIRIPWLCARRRSPEGSDLAFRGKLMIAGSYDGHRPLQAQAHARSSRSRSTAARPPRAT